MLLFDDDTMIFGSSPAIKSAAKVSLDNIVATLSNNDDEREKMKTQIEIQFGKGSKLPRKGKRSKPFGVKLSGLIEFRIETNGIDASDGNCLFLAVVWQLHIPGNDNSVLDSSFVRGETIAHILDHLDYFHHLIGERIGKESSLEDVRHFVFRTLSLHTTYGGRESLIAISERFQSNILVFSKNKLEFIPEFNTSYTHTACLVNKTPEKGNEIHFDGALRIL